MAEVDEATNELIARILAGDAEQNAYNSYDDLVGDGECSDDSDFGQPSRKRGRTGRLKAMSTNQASLRGVTKDGDSLPTELLEEYTESGRRRRRDQGYKRETVSKGWTEKEETLFLEALELYGREWHKAAAHVGTRDKKQFTSHAQKHFIKLCIADKPLPERVIQTGQGSGLGYTLSGHLLEPESASARAYGLRPEHVKRLSKTGGPGLKGLAMPEKENHAIDQTGDGAQPKTNGTSALISKTRKGESHQAKTAKPILKEIVPCEPTEYAKNRPKRDGAGMKSSMGHTSESLELTTCKEFIGPPGSGSALAQPFEVTVDRQVNLVMDFHAHLCGCEIIGLLGGYWDPDKRLVSVKAAYPCDRLEGSHSGTSVEVDPAAQLAAQEEMENAGFISVGWYHSHPIFAALPSEKDNENQRNQQALHRCNVTNLEPCLGAIISPYDQSLPSETSITSWFMVQSKASRIVPFRVRVKDDQEILAQDYPKLVTQFEKLIRATKKDSAKTDFLKTWRQYRLLVDGQASGGGLTYLLKLRLAISHYLRGDSSSTAQASEFLDQILSLLKEIWEIPHNTANPESKAGDQSQDVHKLEA